MKLHGTLVDVRDAVTNLARWLTWVRETKGANTGEVVDRILATVALQPGEPWCAAFVAACGRAVLGRSWPLPRVGGVMSLKDYGEAKGWVSPVPEYGAVFLQWHEAKGRWAHTGFVLAKTAGPAWATVEGNTNEAGSREGDGVYLKARTWGPKDLFIRWWEGLTPPAQGTTTIRV